MVMNHLLVKVKELLNTCLFSSPEHEVLMASFCDRLMSVVRPCVVNFFFKRLLLLNSWANLAETWQECYLHEALPKLFKWFQSIAYLGHRG
jgi:hypothetical protein